METDTLCMTDDPPIYRSAQRASHDTCQQVTGQDNAYGATEGPRKID